MSAGSTLLGVLVGLSVVLTLWQWLAGLRFPLHRRIHQPTFSPALTLLKPLKGCDAHTKDCLRSWLAQDYRGALQILFGVSSAQDPACIIVRELMAEYPERDAQLIVCAESLGINAKVSTLVQLDRHSRHPFVVISDADVQAPLDLLANLAPLLEEPPIGLAHCLYRLANPTSLAMSWEALGVNADFWSQVLQHRSFQPLDYALGAVMATKRTCLESMGGLAGIANFLADDYQLGHQITRQGYLTALCPVVVDCWSHGMSWRQVWHHQIRWSRTIRICKPWPYALSLVSNATLWPLLWLAASPGPWTGGTFLVCLAVRLLAALGLQRRLTQSWDFLGYLWMVPIKDLLQVVLWAMAFMGRHVKWHGERFAIQPDGTLVRD